jgi:hypothetical protein
MDLVGKLTQRNGSTKGVVGGSLGFKRPYTFKIRRKKNGVGTGMGSGIDKNSLGISKLNTPINEGGLKEAMFPCTGYVL